MTTHEMIKVYSGTSITCYHGSNRLFKKFDPDAESNVWDAEYPEGVMFFTNTAERARLYGRYVYKCRINATDVKQIRAPKNQSPERFIDNNSGVFNHLYENSDCIAVTGQGEWAHVTVYALTSPELIKIVSRDG